MQRLGRVNVAYLCRISEVGLTVVWKTAQPISAQRLYEVYNIGFSDLKYLRDLPILSAKIFL